MKRIALMAVLLTLLYEETNNLAACIVTHSFFNTANFVMLLFPDAIARLTAHP